MFGSDTLEVAIGMCFIFLSVSLICTAVREGLESLLKMRAMDLERGVRELLNDPDGTTIAKTFYDHPLIYSLFSGGYDPSKLKVSKSLTATRNSRVMSLADRRNLPSYIPANSFSSALLDIVARGPVSGVPEPGPMDNPLSIENLRASVPALPNERLRRAVLVAIDQAQGDLDAAKKNIEKWFDGTMDRVSGWYKRRTQLLLFMIGIVIAIGLNIDAIHLVDRLSRDKALRQVVVAQAEKISAKDDKTPPQQQSFTEVRNQLEGLGLPIGWPAPQAQTCTAANQCTDKPVGFSGAIKMVLGWFVTAFAVMLGAPFWFDTLNKLMVIRSTVKPHEKSPEEASEDRQAPEPVAVAPTPVKRPAAAKVAKAVAPTVAPAAISFEPHTWRNDGSERGII
jgi:hypothetical protein